MFPHSLELAINAKWTSGLVKKQKIYKTHQQMTAQDQL